MRYFIYVYWQQGNIGPKQVDVILEQPNDGFESEQDAELCLLDLIEKRKGYFFDRDWYKFTIMKTYNSKSALDKI